MRRRARHPPQPHRLRAPFQRLLPASNALFGPPPLVPHPRSGGGRPVASGMYKQGTGREDGFPTPCRPGMLRALPGAAEAARRALAPGVLHLRAAEEPPQLR